MMSDYKSRRRRDRDLEKYNEKRDRLIGKFPAFAPGWEEKLPKDWLKKRQEELREQFETQVAAAITELHAKPAGTVFPATPSATITLTQAAPRATLIARAWVWREYLRVRPTFGDVTRRRRRMLIDRPGVHEPALAVAGLGQYAGQRKARKGIVDIAVYGTRGDPLMDVGAVSDGLVLLPPNATHVRVSLADPKRTATVTICDLPTEPVPSGADIMPLKVRTEKQLQDAEDALYAGPPEWVEGKRYKVPKPPKHEPWGS